MSRFERRPIAPGLDCESCGDFDNRPELPPLPLEREPVKRGEHILYASTKHKTTVPDVVIVNGRRYVPEVDPLQHARDIGDPRVAGR